MKKPIKITFLIIGIIVIVLYLLVIKGVVPINTVPGARTMYTGYVRIEPTSLSEIKIK